MSQKLKRMCRLFFFFSALNLRFFNEHLSTAYFTFLQNENQTRFQFGFMACPSFPIFEKLQQFFMHLFGCGGSNSPDESEDTKKRRIISEEELQHSRSYFNHARTIYPFETGSQRSQIPSHIPQKTRTAPKKPQKSSAPKSSPRRFPQQTQFPLVSLEDNSNGRINSTLASQDDQGSPVHLPVFKQSQKFDYFAND